MPLQAKIDWTAPPKPAALYMKLDLVGETPDTGPGVYAGVGALALFGIRSRPNQKKGIAGLTLTALLHNVRARALVDRKFRFELEAMVEALPPKVAADD